MVQFTIHFSLAGYRVRILQFKRDSLLSVLGLPTLQILRSQRIRQIELFAQFQRPLAPPGPSHSKTPQWANHLDEDFLNACYWMFLIILEDSYC